MILAERASPTLGTTNPARSTGPGDSKNVDVAIPLIAPLPQNLLRPLIECRVRGDRRTDRDFYAPKNDNSTDLLARTRVGLEWKTKGATVQLQYQVAHDEKWTQAHNGMDERRDMRLALVQFSSAGVRYTVGRQPLKKGFGRLVSDCDFNNIGISYEAVHAETPRSDFAFGRLAYSFGGDWQSRFAYASYRSRFGETMLLSKFEPHRAVYTLDQTTTVKAGAWNIEGELALQAGDDHGKDLTAGAGFLRTAFAADSKTDLLVTFAGASGGTGPNAVHTFDQGFSAFHGAHGVSDLCGWRNVTMVGLTAKRKLQRRVDASLTYFRYGLWSAEDAWFSGVGKVNKGPNGVFQDPSGKSGRELGDEVGLEVKWVADSHFTYSAGAAIFHPGHFVEVQEPGRTKDQVYGYLMANYRF